MLGVSFYSRSLFAVVAFVSFAGPAAHATVVIRNSVNLFEQRKLDIVKPGNRGAKIAKTAEEIHVENLVNLAAFVAETSTSYTSNDILEYAKVLGPEQIRHVFQEANENEVVGLYQYSLYDPENRGVGFCFGRAMFTHLELVQHRVHRDSMKKAFVVGPMTTGGTTRWAWHVTTIVRSVDPSGKEIWVAIDPIMSAPMELTEWYQYIYDTQSIDKKLKLYITEPTRFGPKATSYSERLFQGDLYNGYFTDLRKWFHQESISTQHYSSGMWFSDYVPPRVTSPSGEATPPSVPGDATPVPAESPAGESVPAPEVSPEPSPVP